MINILYVFKKRDRTLNDDVRLEGVASGHMTGTKQTSTSFVARCVLGVSSLLLEIFRDTNPKNAKGKEVGEEEEV